MLLCYVPDLVFTLIRDEPLSITQLGLYFSYLPEIQVQLTTNN